MSPIADGTVLTVPTDYERDESTGLNVGTNRVQVLVRYNPDLHVLGEATSGAAFGPARTITLRGWDEQVFLHELLHVAVAPYFEGGYHNSLGDPDGHRLINRIEVTLWELGWRATDPA